MTIKKSAAATLQAKPQEIRITDSSVKALHKMTALIREGYIPTEISSFGATWVMNITLVLGDPDPAIVEEANTDVQHALDLQELERKRQIEAAAVELVAARERAEKRAALDEQIAASERALRALKDQVRAAA